MRKALLDTTPLRTSKPFRRLWIGRALSGFGSQIALVAVMYQVWEATGSTVWTGAVGLAQAIPLVAFGLFAGSLVDRSDRRRVYLIALTGMTAGSVVLAVQGVFGPLPMAGLLVVLAAQSCFWAGAGPAARTFISKLLPREQVAAGLVLQRIMFQASMLAGPAVGGLLIGWFGVGGCYLVDALTFVMAFYGAFSLPSMRPEGEPSRPGLRGIGDGLRFLVSHSSVRGALLTDLAATVLSFPLSLFPLINEERFGGNPRTLGLFLSAIAVGGFVASVFSGTFTRSARPGVFMLAGSATWGLSMVLLGVAPSAWLCLACLVLAGAADTVAVVARGTIVQHHTPNAMLGRVVAAEQIVGQAGPDLGNMRAGLVAGATSGAFSLISGGALCVLAVAAVAAGTRPLREPSTKETASHAAGA
ncbi:putative MFS family arabinose efflux permease [Labedaea rhizosphaerae]|uniref:Putative MFS family arabinose efflux permease n=1 Tax=Labedaea rhizosphaerae TaxID=598644 RepID=A0A4R6RRC1_LABRH|nr:putative MFS family arabinose efflux permease [Labedaea rhizosphaerae]